MRKHYHRVPDIHSFVLIHHDIHLSTRRGTEQTTHVFKETVHVQTRMHKCSN